MSAPESPLPPMMYQHPGTVVASSLSAQLGTNPNILEDGDFDYEILSSISKDDIGPLIGLSMLELVNPNYGYLKQRVLKLKVSENGRGRRDIINMEKASHGGMADMAAELEALRPNWVGRNITNRDWKDDAIRDGQV